MEKQKYLLDDDLEAIDSKNIEQTFEDLMQEEAENANNKKLDFKAFKNFGKVVQDVTEGIGQTAEKVGITAEYLSDTVDKISIAAKKIGTESKELGEKAIKKAKEIDINEVGKILEDGTSKIKHTAKDSYDKVSEKTKEVYDAAKEKLSPEQVKVLLDSLYDKSMTGIPGVSKTVEELVNDYLSKYDDPDKAAKALINNQVTKCATSGFVSGLGGLITLPVAIPANVGSVLYVQMRMIMAIAMLGGFDPKEDQVQTLGYLCITGQAMGDIVKDVGIKIGTKLAKSGINKISGATLTKINQAVGFRLVTKFGTKGAINLGKMVPLVGGVVGGGFDFFSTKAVAKNAYKTFIMKEI